MAASPTARVKRVKRKKGAKNLLCNEITNTLKSIPISKAKIDVNIVLENVRGFKKINILMSKNKSVKLEKWERKNGEVIKGIAQIKIIKNLIMISIKRLWSLRLV